LRDQTLDQLGEIFSRLRTHAPFTGDRIPIDLGPEPPRFDTETEYMVLDKDETVKAVKPDSKIMPVEFEAFVDGVQRTTTLTRLPVAGYPVPIHLAHVAAASILRTKDKRLIAPPNLINDRILLIMPLTLMLQEGWEENEFMNFIKEYGIEQDKSDEAVYRISSLNKRILLCDITHTGIGSEQGKNPSTSLSVVDLADPGLISSRALGRVKWIRTILEMLTLHGLRSEKPEAWVIVDGPLIFLKTQAEHMKRAIGKDFDPLVTLKNAVGLVKDARLRLKKEELKIVYDLDEDECSSIIALNQCVDLKGSLDIEKDEYDKKHLTSFARLRRPKLGLKLPTADGLIGVDTYLSTFGFERSDDVTKENMRDRIPLFHSIVNGIWRERWPGIKDRKRALTQIYPIEQTERLLHSKLYSLREMAYLASKLKII